MFNDTKHPQIMGAWVRADDSDNALEFATTTRPGVIAIRDTYARNEMIFATSKQLLNFVEAVDKGRLSLF